MSDQARIRAFLRAVRARLRLRQWANESALAALVSAACLFVYLCLAGSAQPSAFWNVGYRVLLCLCVAAFAVALVRPFARYRRDENVARIVGERIGRSIGQSIDRNVGENSDGRAGAEDLVLSAIELSASLHFIDRKLDSGLDAEPNLGSPELARAHVRQVAERLSRVRPKAVVELGGMPSRKRLTVAAGIALGWLLLLAASQQRLLRGWAALHGSKAATRAPSPEPIVGDLELRLTFPAYMGLPDRSIPGSSGEVLAPPGTLVNLRARPLLSSVRAAEIELLDADGKTLSKPKVVIEQGLLATSFTVTRAGSYRYVLERGGMRGVGGPVREPEAHPIEIEADKAPAVTLAAPADDLELSGPKRVQLAFSAVDDHGLDDLQLVWTWTANSEERDDKPGDKPSDKQGGKAGGKTGGSDGKVGGKMEGRKVVRAGIEGQSASGNFEWDLADLDLRPGLRLTYHLEARDHDNVSGPNVGSSRSYTLRIYTQAEKHEELLVSEQALADHAVALLGDRLDAENRSDGGGASDGAKLVAAIAKAHSKCDEFLAEVTKVESELARDPVAPRDLKPALSGIRTRLGKLFHEEDAARRDVNLRGAAAIDERACAPLREGNGRHVIELEKDAILLADLLARQRLEQLLAVADEMQAGRDRLKQLLGEFKKTHSDAVRQEIEREMRKLQQKLAELADKAGKLEGEVPDQFVNREAASGSDIGKRLDKIKELLDKGDVDKAMAELSALSSSLDKIAQSMESDLKNYRNERFSAEEKAMAELESKLSDLEHEERDLQKETDEVWKRQREEGRRMARERIDPFVKRAKEKVAEIKKKLGAVERQTLQPFDQEQYDKAKRRVEDLKSALDQGDLEETREMAGNASGELRQLSTQLREEEDRRWEAMKPEMRKAREKVDEAEPLARQISDEIEQLLPKAGEMLGPAERKKLSELSARQEALHKRTEEARREAEKKLRGGQTEKAEKEAQSSQPGMGSTGTPNQSGTAPGQAGPQSQQPAQPGQPGASGPSAMLKEAGDHMGRAGGALREGNPRDSSGEEGQAAERLGQLRKEMQNERRPRSDGESGSQSSKEVVKIPGADEWKAPREFRQDLLDAMKREAPGEYKNQVKRFYEELVK